MTIQRAKIALNSARFPLVSTKGSRAVFVPGMDSAPRTPRQFMGTEDSADYNFPQMLYMENVMPLAEGYRSVGIARSIAPHTTPEGFDQAIILRDSLERATLVVPAGGLNYVYDSSALVWDSQPCSLIWPGVEGTWATSTVTHATVSGYSFLCYGRAAATVGTANVSIVWWDEENNQFDDPGSLITNLPFAYADVDGISASNGYLLVWSGLEVAWAGFDISTNSFNFAPYANGEFTGNGSQIPEDVKGQITALGRIPGGFLIFTTRNTVASVYSSANLVSPWAFKEVAGAGGVETVEQLSSISSLGSIFAYTTSGLQRISLNSAELVHPTVSDFLAGRQIERYDAGTLTSTEYASDLDSKLAVIGNRYLVISYGVPGGAVFEFALIIDLALQRIGKVKVDHVDVFELAIQVDSEGLTYAAAAETLYSDYPDTAYSALSTPVNALTYAPHMVSFLRSTGEVLTANWAYDTRSATDEGVAILGRIQLSRSRHTELNRIEIEGTELCTVRVIPSYNGASLETPVELTVVESAPGYLCVGGEVGCKNFNIEITGTFALSTLIIEAQTSGQN